MSSENEPSFSPVSLSSSASMIHILLPFTGSYTSDIGAIRHLVPRVLRHLVLRNLEDLFHRNLQSCENAIFEFLRILSFSEIGVSPTHSCRCTVSLNYLIFVFFSFHFCILFTYKYFNHPNHPHPQSSPLPCYLQ